MQGSCPGKGATWAAEALFEGFGQHRICGDVTCGMSEKWPKSTVGEPNYAGHVRNSDIHNMLARRRCSDAQVTYIGADSRVQIYTDLVCLNARDRREQGDGGAAHLQWSQLGVNVGVGPVLQGQQSGVEVVVQEAGGVHEAVLVGVHLAAINDGGRVHCLPARNAKSGV